MTTDILMVPFSKSHTPRLNKSKELPDRNFGVPKIVKITVTFPATHKTHITQRDEMNKTSQTSWMPSPSIGIVVGFYAAVENKGCSTEICHGISIH